MTIRNPKGKAAQTIASQKLKAIAHDVRNAANVLDDIAHKYTLSGQDYEMLAALADATIDRVNSISRTGVWPRTHLERLVHAPNGKVYGKHILPTPNTLVILCPSLEVGTMDVRQLDRNPRDRRLLYVFDDHSLTRVNGLRRDTPWCVTRDWNIMAAFHNRACSELRARFEQRKRMSVAEGISLLDWTTTGE